MSLSKLLKWTACSGTGLSVCFSCKYLDHPDWPACCKKDVWKVCLCCADAKQNGVVGQFFANDVDRPNVAKRTVGNDKFHTHRIWPARADEPLRASITTCLLQTPNMTNHGLAAANSSDTVDTYHAVWSSNWHRRHSLSLGSLKVSLESLVFQLTKWAEESFTRDISRLSGVVRLQ